MNDDSSNSVWHSTASGERKIGIQIRNIFVFTLSLLILHIIQPLCKPFKASYVDLLLLLQMIILNVY